MEICLYSLPLELILYQFYHKYLMRIPCYPFLVEYRCVIEFENQLLFYYPYSLLMMTSLMVG
jgi:hypothetical protein